MKNIRSYGWMAVGVAVLLAAPALSASASENSTNTTDKTFSGTITLVNSQESLLAVKGLFFSKKFNLGNDCVYVLMDKSTGGVNDLRAGQKATVDYREKSGVLIADRVELVPQIFEGQVTALDATNQTMTVSVHWLDKKFQLASNCVVVLHNDKTGSLPDVQLGSHVIVNYETPDKVPTACKIMEKSISYTGTVTAIDQPNRVIKTKTLFGSKKFNVADNCAIVVNGKTDGQLSDLKPNGRLTFNYDEVNGVNIANRIAPVPMTVDTNRATSTYVTQPGTGY